MTTPSKRAAARPPLTRERIIDTAIVLIEREGDDGVSMRRIAAELGVAPMSLYNHIPSKSMLLEGIANRVLSMLTIDDASKAWQDRARSLLRGYHDLARSYPRCVSFLLRRSIETTSGLRPIENALALAHDAGFDGAMAVSIMRALLAYAVGANMRESGSFHTPSAVLEQLIKSVDRHEFPYLAAAVPELIHSDPDADFDFGLDLLLTAIDALPRGRKRRR